LKLRGCGGGNEGLVRGEWGVGGGGKLRGRGVGQTEGFVNRLFEI